MPINRIISLMAFLLAGVVASDAAPLKTGFCDSVLQKHSDLDLEKILDWMANGPDWAKENLTRAELGEIKTYISTEELLKFRCNEFVPPPVPNPLPHAERGIIADKKSDNKNSRLSTHSVPLPPKKPI